MKLVIQVVSKASVRVEGETVGAIGKGFMTLVGIAENDNAAIADKMLEKMLKLRIFPDENGKTNLSIRDVGGELLLISQFTLYADTSHGNRPGFTTAGKPEMAEPLYRYFCDQAEKAGMRVGRGIFGADMQVSLVNEGPFTIILDSDEIIKK